MDGHLDLRPFILATHRHHPHQQAFPAQQPNHPQAYKADVSLLLQGKADSKDLESAAALVRFKVRWGRGLAVAPGDSAYRFSLHGRC